MEWHRLDTKLLLDPDLCAADDAQVANWLRLLLFCAIQENCGKIERARLGTKVASLSQAAIDRVVTARLASWDGDDLIVRWFDVDGQRKCESNRVIGSRGGIKAKENRSLVAKATANGAANASTHRYIDTNIEAPTPWVFCGFHVGGRNQDRRSVNPDPTCTECTDAAARGLRKNGGPKAIAALLPKVGT